MKTRPKSFFHLNAPTLVLPRFVSRFALSIVTYAVKSGYDFDLHQCVVLLRLVHPPHENHSFSSRDSRCILQHSNQTRRLFGQFSATSRVMLKLLSRCLNSGWFAYHIKGYCDFVALRICSVPVLPGWYILRNERFSNKLISTI